MGDGKELLEKLGRNDLCPCGNGRRFKKCCMRGGGHDGANRHDYFQGLRDGMKKLLRRLAGFTAALMSACALAGHPAADVGDVTLPPRIHECETWTATVCGTWTLDGDHYAAVWEDGSRATIHIVTFTATRAMFVREDVTGKSAGMTAWYDGAVSENRVVRGRVTWRKDGGEWGNVWQAEWEE